MTLHKIERLDDYVKYVQSNRDELQALYKDMLITVTSFFRDPEPFEALKDQVFPRLLEHKEPGAPIRVWVPACATGEEAYSIAICLLEFCEEQAPRPSGSRSSAPTSTRTRSSTRAAASTRRTSRSTSRPSGSTGSSSRRTTSTRISRRDPRHGRVLEAERPQGRAVLADRPGQLPQPAHLPAAAAQKKVLRILHYALNPPGYLLLGSSETVGDAPELFSLVDRKNKIYVEEARRSRTTALDVGFGVPAPLERPAAGAGRAPDAEPAGAGRPQGARALRAAGRGGQRGPRRSSSSAGTPGPTSSRRRARRASTS